MRKLFLVLSTFLMCFILFACAANDKQYNNVNAGNVFNYMMQYDDFERFVIKHETFEKGTDPDKLLGKANQYTSKVSWSVDKLNNSSEETYNGGTIEVFNNEKDAKLRSDFLNLYASRMKETFSEEEYGEVAKTMWKTNKYVYQNRNVVISIWSSIDEGFADSYFKELDQTLESVQFQQSKSPSEDTVNKLTNKNKEVIEVVLKDAKQTFDKELNETASSVDYKVYDYVNGQTTYELEDVLLYIYKSYNTPFFRERREEWVAKLSSTYSMNNVVNHATLTSAYGSSEKYTVGKDIAEGSYTITSNGNKYGYVIIRGNGTEETEYQFINTVNENGCEYQKKNIILHNQDVIIISNGLNVYNFNVTLVPSNEEAPEVSCY